jgi:Tfp pilus assembly protein PilZ
MDARAEPRFRRKTPCKLRHQQRHHSGMVLDISRTGLFVQTSATAQNGEEVEVTLSVARTTALITLAAQVVWQRRVPAQLRAAAEGGLGLRICYAPEGYYNLLVDAAQGSITRRERAV